MRASQARMEAVLEQCLPQQDGALARLYDGMRYAVLGGGKRVRALLVQAAGELVAAPQPRLEAVAAAVEMIHAYSLVHDDLPCMDDDILRRGKPTVHVQFDEATALLVGDGLQARAFELLCETPLADQALVQLAMIRLLAGAAGPQGMVGGQAIDLENVGKKLDRTALEQMHRLKTGALIRASVLLGAQCGRPLADAERAAVEAFAATIGLLFQVVDDILDVVASTAALGKTAGKDADQNKPTYVSLLGLEEARQFARTLRTQAFDALAPFGSRAARLLQLTDFIVQRQF